MLPSYDLDKIKFATDAPTFERAVELYGNGRVTKFKAEFGGFSAIVIGTKSYEVYVSARHYDEGSCTCYLGQNETLCKHMVAVAICAVTGGKPLNNDDKKIYDQPICSGKLKELDKKELAAIKKSITAAMRYIKSYVGPSRIWFAYQNSLSEGCNRLSKIISGLPVNLQTAELLVDVLLRLDDRVCRGGVDDSDGTVGGFMEQTVNVLLDFVKIDKNCAKAFVKLKGVETSFGWEEPLVKLAKKWRRGEGSSEKRGTLPK